MSDLFLTDRPGRLPASNFKGTWFRYDASFCIRYLFVSDDVNKELAERIRVFVATSERFIEDDSISGIEDACRLIQQYYAERALLFEIKASTTTGVDLIIGGTTAFHAVSFDFAITHCLSYIKFVDTLQIGDEPVWTYREILAIRRAMKQGFVKLQNPFTKLTLF